MKTPGATGDEIRVGSLHYRAVAPKVTVTTPKRRNIVSRILLFEIQVWAYIVGWAFVEAVRLLI